MPRGVAKSHLLHPLCADRDCSPGVSRGSRLGSLPCRRVLSVCPAYRQCALRVEVVCRPRLVRHDVRLVPRPGPPGLRPGGPGSARGPSGEYRVSALHIGGAPCMWEWFVGLVSSVTTCGWYLLERGPAQARRPVVKCRVSSLRDGCLVNYCCVAISVLVIPVRLVTFNLMHHWHCLRVGCTCHASCSDCN